VKLDRQSVVADDLGGRHLFAWFEYQNSLDAGFPSLNCERQPGQGATDHDKIDLQRVHDPTIAVTSPSGKSVTGD
jgi:hypothetical protein